VVVTPAATLNVTLVKPEIVHPTRACVSPLNAPATDRNAPPIAEIAELVMRVVDDGNPTASSVWMVNVIVPAPETAVTFTAAYND
jgi:hypothetical protein